MGLLIVSSKLLVFNFFLYFIGKKERELLIFTKIRSLINGPRASVAGILTAENQPGSGCHVFLVLKGEIIMLSTIHANFKILLQL
jgi:hypothetical protein